MNRFAYRTTGLAIKTLYRLSRAQIRTHGEEHIPDGPIIFVINHFTRIETLLLPYYLNRLTKSPVWSLASYELFKGSLGNFLDKVGAVSTDDPDRDRLIVRSLLLGRDKWIIFPEGRMVKSKKIVEKGRYMISYAGGKHPPHTGAATLAIRAEFYRQRLLNMAENDPEEAGRLLKLFRIEDLLAVSSLSTQIVPVNLTYYPLRAKENFLSDLATKMVGDISDRMLDEVMTEGSMLLSGVNIDMRFGPPLSVYECTRCAEVSYDIGVRRQINFDDAIPSKKRMRKEALKVMQRYMTSIYSMTTVNHDHLFASMLSLIPKRTVSARNLRARVFLASMLPFNKMGVHVHHSMDEGQLALITDDRYDKYKDFVTFAEAREVIQRHGDAIVKNKEKFASAFDFHTIRIENPINVIVNETEPLVMLRRALRKIAWTPGFWVRRQVARRLEDKAMFDYETDYATHYTEGVSKSLEVGRPFLIKGKFRRIGVLLIHGYMAAPLEVKELAKYLGRMGYWVYVPRLKGHGTTPDDLANRTYLEWIDSVEEGYGIISNRCKRVVVGGFSTGAGLALDLAARIETLEGVFAVCPPLKFQEFASKLVPAVDAWNKLMHLMNLEGATKEFVENNPENPHINYFQNPVAGVRQLERLMTAVEPKLASIKVPALVAQSFGDPVVDHRGARRVFQRLGSADKEYILFNFNRHGILLGEGSHRVYTAIGNFLNRLQRNKPS